MNMKKDLDMEKDGVWGMEWEWLFSKNYKISYKEKCK